MNIRAAADYAKGHIKRAVSMHSGMGMPSTAPSGWINKGFPVVQ